MKASTGRETVSYEFGPFRVDPDQRVLLRDGSPVPILPKSFDALLVLVRNSRRLLDKEFLLAEIWPDTHVEENNLAHAISDIRKALGEGPKDQRYVVTVPRRGYRFAASVESVELGCGQTDEKRGGRADASLGGPPEGNPHPSVFTAIGPTQPIDQDDAKRPRSLLLPGVAAAAAIAVLSVGVMFFSRQSPPAPLADKDVLVLADFTNNTGDPVFDGTLREALAVQLERSPFLKVMGDAQMRQSLRLMGRAPDQRLANDAAREVCVREREKATIGGSITSLGTTYTINLQATACESGETLAREQVEAKDKSQVLAALGRAATGMRQKLGESLSSIQQLERHAVTEVSTPSLEAFQVYARGTDLYRRGLPLQAIPFFERAVELDPDFAMAFQLLANAYGSVGESAPSIEYSRRAFALIGRVSERERLLISAAYHMRVTGDTAKWADAVRLFVQTFPRAPTPRNYRASFFASTGEFEKAAHDLEELLRLDPQSWIGYSNLIAIYIGLDRFDEAHAVAEKAFAQGLDAPGLHRGLLRLALMQDDTAAAARQIEWFDRSEEQYVSLDMQASNALVRGQRRRASDLLRRAADDARRRKLHGPADVMSEAAAADPFGDCQVEARVPPRGAGGDSLVTAIRACADIHVALSNAEAALKQRPADTLLGAVVVPMRRAALALRRNQPAKAIELLDAAAPFERSYPEVVYLRGLAYLHAGKSADAATEFQKIINHQGAYWGSRFPLAYLGLARALVQAGNVDQGRKAYRDFFVLWRSADPDIPLLIEAKKEFAALN